MRTSMLTLVLLLGACNVTVNNNAADNESNMVATNAPGAVTLLGNEATPQANSTMPLPPEPANAVSFTAAPARASPGATMTLTLTNNAGSPVGYNLCTSTIEPTSGQPVQSDRVCTMEIRTLDPDKSATYSYDLPKTIALGTYRFSTRIEMMQSGTMQIAKSNSFDVR